MERQLMFGRSRGYVEIQTLKEGLVNLTVKDLTDVETLTWKDDFNRNVFIQEDADSILELPIMHITERDRIIWSCSLKGMYQVRSAYYLLMENIIDNSHLKVPGEWGK